MQKEGRKRNPGIKYNMVVSAFFQANHPRRTVAAYSIKNLMLWEVFFIRSREVLFLDCGKFEVLY